MIVLSNYLEKDKILLNFKAADFDDALKQMLAVSSEERPLQLIGQINEREKLMSTTLGKGVALPRLVVEGKARTEIIIALSKEGINLKGLDLLPVEIIFLFLFSKDDDCASILAQALRFLNNNSLRVELTGCVSGKQVVSVIKKWEEE